VWLAIIGLLNSGVSAAYYLRLAFTAAQRPEDGEVRGRVALPRLGIAVGAALLFSTGATLWLGIKPNGALRAAETAAHTLQVPGADTTTQGSTESQPPRP
jgi:NADH-quinone oxidoreductase subunit N